MSRIRSPRGMPADRIMRNLLLVIVVLATIQNWDKLTELVSPSPEVIPGEYAVVMYGAQWCGYCAKARELFESKGIAYREYDIEKSSEAHRQFKALGGRGVPLIVIDDKVIKGYSKQGILAALRDQ